MSRQSFQFEPLAKTLEKILVPSKDIASAAPALLEAVAKCIEGEWAAYWKVDPDRHELRVIATWSRNPVPPEPLFRDAERRTLTVSEGAAGRVWNSGRPLCTSDLIRDMRLPRSLYAKAAGFSGGIWFPIRANRTIYGIIESLGHHPWPSEQLFLDQLVTLGETIGEMLPERS